MVKNNPEGLLKHRQLSLTLTGSDSADLSGTRNQKKKKKKTIADIEHIN